MMRSFKIASNTRLFVMVLVFMIMLLGSLVVIFQDQMFLKLFPEKIWVHRVNSIEKRNAVQAVYSGVELDVDFLLSENVFDVNHPPAKSIRLDLFEYFKTCEARDDLFFWLDFKNLSMSNAEPSLSLLDSICHSLGLNKATIVVEAFVPQALQLFSNSGYKTSYYLAPANYEPKGEEKDAARIAILELLDQYPSSYISFDRRYYRFVRKNIPDYPMLTWGFYERGMYRENDLNFSSFLYSGKALFHKLFLFLDEDVEVVLFSYDGGSGNR